MVFADWAATVKAFQWNNWYGHVIFYYVAMETWLFSSKFQLSFVTVKHFHIEQFAMYGISHSGKVWQIGKSSVIRQTRTVQISMYN